MNASLLRLDDGFSTIFTLENAPTIKLYERDVTPPSLGNGGPIETTTMRNIAWRTSAPKQLKTAGQITAICAYATSVIPVLQEQLGINQRITVTFPDGATMMFWGWMDAFTPAQMAEGTQPTANVVFHPSNRDTDGAEVAPLYTPPADDSAVS